MTFGRLQRLALALLALSRRCPHSGPGSTTHGASQQFMAAISFFNGKTRQ